MFYSNGNFCLAWIILRSVRVRVLNKSDAFEQFCNFMNVKGHCIYCLNLVSLIVLETIQGKEEISFYSRGGFTPSN